MMLPLLNSLNDHEYPHKRNHNIECVIQDGKKLKQGQQNDADREDYANNVKKPLKRRHKYPVLPHKNSSNLLTDDRCTERKERKSCHLEALLAERNTDDGNT